PAQLPARDDRRLVGPGPEERRLSGPGQDERRLVGPAQLPAHDLPRRGDRYVEQPQLSPEIPAPGSRADWPLNGGAGLSDQALPAAPDPAPGNGRVTPPWQADDLPAEPPTLRLVDADRPARRPE